MSAQGSITRPLQFLRSWFGGWSLLLLIVVVVGVIGGVLWERNRHVPIPSGATQVSASLLNDVRLTTFRYNSSPEQVRSFYREALTQRGWQYCGTQETPHCTNMISLVGGGGAETDVYRRSNDQNKRGSTIEMRPIATDNGQTYVTLYETRSK